jgi:hypothetical protein
MPTPNFTPIFTITPNCPSVLIDSANVTRDGSGVLFTLFTAGVNGSLLNKITFTNAASAVGASALKVCRIFVTNTSGTNPRLRGEILLPAVTSSNTVIGATATFTFIDGLVLAPGQVVRVSQSLRATAADDTHAIAEGGDY